MEAAQLAIDQDTENQVLREQLRGLEQKAEQLATSETKFFSQKTGKRNLIHSDKNTAFFHSMVKTNNTRNTISFLCRDDGSIMDDQDDIIEVFVSFYKSLFGTEKASQATSREVLQNGPLLSEEKMEGLIREVSAQAIKDALFKIDEGKAPGPDGFSSTFFKKNWDFVGADFVEAIREFFHTGQLLKKSQHNHHLPYPKDQQQP